MGVKISIQVGSGLPSGKPTESELLADGRTRYLMEDGRRLTVPSAPTYAIEYLSSWVGAAPDDTYTVNVAIAGLSAIDGCFEVWNFDIGQVRNYAFRKTMLVTQLETGETFTGPEFEAALRRSLPSGAPAPAAPTAKAPPPPTEPPPAQPLELARAGSGSLFDLIRRFFTGR